MTQELGEVLPILSALIVIVFVLSCIMCMWADRRNDVRYNDYGINKDARLK